MIFSNKSFISYGVIFSILLTVLHTNVHYHEKHDGYSFCDVKCNEKKHHLDNHQCEICINNNSAITLVNICSKISYKYFSHIVTKFEYQKKSYLNSNLLSRPPPALIYT